MSIKSSSYDYHLLKGSHDFPGTNGGACLNEVAVVVAGYEYRSIMSSDDAPACFCPVLTSFSIVVNDAVSDGWRQTMKKFVVRMAGSKDEAAAQQRADTIAFGVIQKVVPVVLAKLPDFAKRFRVAEDFETVNRIIKDLKTRFDSCNEFSAFSDYVLLADAMRLLQRKLYMSNIGKAEWAGDVLSKSITTVESCYKDQIMQIAIDLVEEGLSIGRQAPPIPDVEALLRWSAAIKPVRETA